MDETKVEMKINFDDELENRIHTTILMNVLANAEENPVQACLSVKKGDINRDSDISNSSQSTFSESVSLQNKFKIDVHLPMKFKQKTSTMQLKLLVFFRKTDYLSCYKLNYKSTPLPRRENFIKT